MKSDLSRLMAERRLDAIVVAGNTDSSADLAYVIGDGKLEGAVFIQQSDGRSLLIASALEREVAETSGHPVRLWTEFDLDAYLRRHDNDRLAAMVALCSDLFRECGLAGRVGFYGEGASGRWPIGDTGSGYVFLNALAAANPHIEIVGELSPNIFQVARETKDAAEIAAMQRVGMLTCEVVDSVVRFIKSHDEERSKTSRKSIKSN